MIALLSLTETVISDFKLKPVYGSDEALGQMSQFALSRFRLCLFCTYKNRGTIFERMFLLHSICELKFYAFVRYKTFFTFVY